jgi:quercetin dioxygenase-like cupin family protein
MSRKRKAALATVLIAVPVIGANVLPSAAQQPPPPPIATEVLTGRAVFPDDVDAKVRIKFDGQARRVVHVVDPTRTVVARFTLQPGAQFPWHTHAGPVIVNVTRGELTYIDGHDCAERTYGAGTAFVDAGHGHTHTAFNATGEPTVLVATFFEAPAEGPLVIPVEPPADCTA